MKILKYLLLAIVALPTFALLILWGGAAMSLDRTGSYSEAVGALPTLAEQPAGLVRIAANDMEFRARVAGFAPGQGAAGNVVLLHGFPETSIMWEPLVAALAEAGYRVVAFDQRGYSPGARPEGVGEYVMPQLIGDLMAVAAAAGFDEFHLVGHDWGSAVGWAATMALPAKVQTYNALSIPHVAAFGEAMADENSEQRQKSSYMAFFAAPWFPERVFAFDDFDMLKNNLYADHGVATVAEYLEMFAEPGALTGALNWYRASALAVVGGESGDDAPELDPYITLPVQFIWGNQDQAVSAQSVEMHRKYLKGVYREVELEAGHWLMEEEPAVVIDRIVDFISANS
jgi:pimeloyl-ACP methyl ester carboxylesterase